MHVSTACELKFSVIGLAFSRNCYLGARKLGFVVFGVNRVIRNTTVVVFIFVFDLDSNFVLCLILISHFTSLMTCKVRWFELMLHFYIWRVWKLLVAQYTLSHSVFHPDCIKVWISWSYWDSLFVLRLFHWYLRLKLRCRRIGYGIWDCAPFLSFFLSFFFLMYCHCKLWELVFCLCVEYFFAGRILLFMLLLSCSACLSVLSYEVFHSIYFDHGLFPISKAL